MKTALLSALGLMLAVLATGAWVTYVYLEDSDKRLHSLFTGRVVAGHDLQRVREIVGDAIPRLIAEAGAGQSSPAAIQSESGRLAESARKSWTAYRATKLAPEEARLAPQAEADLAAILEAVPAMLERARDASSPDGERAADQAREQFAPALRQIDALSDLQVSLASREMQSARAARVRALVALTALAAACLAIKGLLSFWLLRKYRWHQAEWSTRMLRVQNMYAALSAAHQMLIRMSTPDALWSEVCDICVRSGRADVVCVVLRDGDEVKLVAKAGATSAFDGFPTRWDLDGPATGRLVGNTVIRSERPTICNVEEMVDVPPWRDALLKHGIQSLGGFPVRCTGKVGGALVLYSRERDFFDAEMCRLLTELADDVSFTLEVLEGRRAREAALVQAKEMEQLFHHLFHLLPVTAILSDASTHELIEVNESTCQRYGMTREAMVGHTMTQLGVGPTPIHRDEIYRQMAQNGEVNALEIEGTNGRGEPFQSLVYARFIDYRGRHCLLSSATDITRLKAMQIELQKKAQADAANVAKTVFLSQMSHELRTPLNAMLGLAQLLKEHAESRLLPEQQRWLAHIQEAGWFLLSLIDDVLDLSRIELGRMDVTLAPVQLVSLVDEAIRLVMSRFARHGIQVSSTVPQHLFVRCDRKRMQQVLVNVLSNAVKYNQEGGSVTVEAAADGRNVCLRIMDSGVGMSQEQVGRLFEPFNRLGRDRSEIEGFGIGLALSRELVQLMHGSLEVQSQVEVGTTVSIVVPLDVEVQAANDQVVPRPFVSDEESRIRGKVLYIEDNEINVMVVQHALLALPGVQFEAAGDGASGLAACVRMRPDLVLLDMQLPDMSGLAVLERLREDRESRPMPVIALSANAMPVDIETARAAGADAYLTKPLDLRPFLAKVVQFLKAA